MSVIKSLDKIGNLIERAVQWLAIVGGAATVLFICAGVTTRYVFNFSKPWMEECAKYTIVCPMFLFAATMIRRDGHIHFTLILSRVKGYGQHLLRLGITIIGLGVSIFMAKYSLGLLMLVRGWQEVTESGLFLLWWVYSFMFVGMVLCVLYYLEQLVKRMVTVIHIEKRLR